MSIDHPEAPRPLPDRPNLRHLKDQAKDLFKAGAASSIADAQFTARIRTVRVRSWRARPWDMRCCLAARLRGQR
jgi:hypothetical protein